MDDHQTNARPSGEGCFGRDALASEVMRGIAENGSVLLFGSRRTGKTTLCRFVLQKYRPSSFDSVQVDLPVYVDLMSLPTEAGPKEFFGLLTNAARRTCAAIAQESREEWKDPDASKPREALGAFVEDITQLQNHYRPCQVRFVFLLDESKRILGGRFPRGLQDNLFSMLYGGEETISPRIGIVFCGAQELLEFSVDDTSPIASRAARICITGLTNEAIRDLGNTILGSGTADSLTNLSVEIRRRTGGHAGIVKRFFEKLATSSTLGESAAIDAIKADLDRELSELFRITIVKMTTECTALLPVLRERSKLRLSEAVHELHKRRLDRFAAQRVFEEMTFSGASIGSHDEIIAVNELFWDYFDRFTVDEPSPSNNADLWRLIRETELQLRELVRTKYVRRWNSETEKRMRGVLGDESWAKIVDNKKKSDQQYPLSIDKKERDIMSCMYLGQLMQLMIAGTAWGDFKHLFRDKRQLEDLLKAIVPVRNDEAHFGEVPPKEQQRCQVACGDLLVIVERELLNIKGSSASLGSDVEATGGTISSI